MRLKSLVTPVAVFGVLLGLPLMLQGCVAAAITGAAVGTAVGVTGAVIGTSAKVVGAAIPGDDDDEKKKKDDK